MFIETTDYALERTTIGDTEVAIAYDDYADTPLECLDLKGFSVVHKDPRMHRFGYDEAARFYYAALEDVEEHQDLISFLENQHDPDPEVIKELREELEDYEKVLEQFDVLEWTDTEEYGHPEYTIIIDRERFNETWGPTLDAEDTYLSFARQYSAWANGSVFVIGIQNDDNAEFIHNNFGDITIDEAVEIARSEYPEMF